MENYFFCVGIDGGWASTLNGYYDKHKWNFCKQYIQKNSKNFKTSRLIYFWMTFDLHFLTFLYKHFKSHVTYRMKIKWSDPQTVRNSRDGSHFGLYFLFNMISNVVWKLIGLEKNRAKAIFPQGKKANIPKQAWWTHPSGLKWTELITLYNLLQSAYSLRLLSTFMVRKDRENFSNNEELLKLAMISFTLKSLMFNSAVMMWDGLVSMDTPVDCRVKSNIAINK